jgi:hypothetical protein
VYVLCMFLGLSVRVRGCVEYRYFRGISTQFNIACSLYESILSAPIEAMLPDLAARQLRDKPASGLGMHVQYFKYKYKYKIYL